MAMTDKYDLETYAYSVTDKSGIATANAEKLDDHIHTRLSGTFGEAVDEYEAVYLKSDGKYWLAQADGTAQPCIGLAVDSGIAEDSGRVHRVGPITNSAWAWANIGGYVYLDPTTPGGLTQTAPSNDAQVIGIAMSATTIYVSIILLSDVGGGDADGGAADDDMHSLAAETTVADSDEVLIYDTSAGAYRKMTRSNFLTDASIPQTTETGRLYTSKLEYKTVAAGAAETLLNYTGTGVLRELFVAMAATDYLSRERSLIKIYIDGEVTPSVEATLANFHCADYSPNNNTFNSKYVGYSLVENEISFYRYINIPFTTSIKIDIENGSSAAEISNLWAVAAYHAGVSLNWGRFQRLKTFEQRTNVNAYATQDILNISGRGVLHGIYMLMNGPDANLHFLEGNIKIYIDGETSPSLEWSGTEDYFNWGFYFQGGIFTSDFIGVTKKSDTGGVLGAYRFHVDDPIPFDTAIQVTWDNGDVSQGSVSGQTYLSSMAWYYLDS